MSDAGKQFSDYATVDSRRSSRSGTPLLRNYFANVQIKPEQILQFKLDITKTITRAIKSETAFLQSRDKRSSEWKHLKSKEDVDLYLNCKSSVVVSIGTIRSTTQDLLYGDYTPTDGDVHERTAYVENVGVRDARLVCTIEASEGLPYDNTKFQSLKIKWVLVRVPIPGATLFVKQRDVLFLEALGYYNPPGQDSSAPIAYYIMKPCHIPEISPFPSYIRSNVTVISLYRQLAPDVVQLFALNAVELRGGLSDKLSVHVSATLALRTFSVVRYVETKKLMSLTATTNEESERETTHHADKNCLICHQSLNKSIVQLSINKKRTCDICGMHVCSTCSVRKRVQGKMKLWCCLRCIAATKTVLFTNPAGTDGSVKGTPVDIALLDSPEDVGTSADDVVTAVTDLEVDEEMANKLVDEKLSLSKALDSDDTNLETFDTLLESAEKLSIQNYQNDEILEEMGGSLRENVLDETNSLHPAPLTRTYSSPMLHDHHANLYKQMLALRMAAETAYELTQANKEAMKG